MSRYCKHGNISDMCMIGECDPAFGLPAPTSGSAFPGAQVHIKGWSEMPGATQEALAKMIELAVKQYMTEDDEDDS